MADIQPDALAEAQRTVEALGVKAVPFVVDVCDRQAMYRAAGEVESTFGKIHLLINNAGIGYTGVPLDKTPDADFHWVFSVNTFGVWNGIAAFLPKIRAHGEGGHIVNTASVAGLFVAPDRHAGLYSATKMAVVALSQGLRDAVKGEPIGVSVLLPGMVATNIFTNRTALNPQKRAGQKLMSEEYGPTPAALAQMAAEAISPEQAGRILVRGIHDDAFLVFTDPNTLPFFHRWVEMIEAGISYSEKVVAELRA